MTVIWYDLSLIFGLIFYLIQFFWNWISAILGFRFKEFDAKTRSLAKHSNGDYMRACKWRQRSKTSRRIAYSCSRKTVPISLWTNDEGWLRTLKRNANSWSRATVPICVHTYHDGRSLRSREEQALTEQSDGSDVCAHIRRGQVEKLGQAAVGTRILYKSDQYTQSLQTQVFDPIEPSLHRRQIIAIHALKPRSDHVYAEDSNACGQI